MKRFFFVRCYFCLGSLFGGNTCRLLQNSPHLKCALLCLDSLFVFRFPSQRCAELLKWSIENLTGSVPEQERKSTLKGTNVKQQYHLNKQCSQRNPVFKQLHLVVAQVCCSLLNICCSFFSNLMSILHNFLRKSGGNRVKYFYAIAKIFQVEVRGFFFYLHHYAVFLLVPCCT